MHLCSTEFEKMSNYPPFAIKNYAKELGVVTGLRFLFIQGDHDWPRISVASSRTTLPEGERKTKINSS
jgi:hypothetical protein